jgi:hypothetical protein
MQGHRGARPCRRHRACKDREATPASADVAARWPPLLAPVASASPPCPMCAARPPTPAKFVGRFRPLAVNTYVRPHNSANKPSRSDRSALRLAAVTRPMPQEARQALERALCGVLERRHPGRRFAMKDQLDTLSHRSPAASATTANTHRLKDAA